MIQMPTLKQQITRPATAKQITKETLVESIRGSSICTHIQLSNAMDLRNALSLDYRNQYATVLTIMQLITYSKCIGDSNAIKKSKKMLVRSLRNFKTYSKNLIRIIRDYNRYRDPQEKKVKLKHAMHELFEENRLAQELEQLAMQVPSVVSIDGSIDFARLKNLIRQMIQVYEQAGEKNGRLHVLELAFEPFL